MAKRRRADDNVDRLSDLPDCLLHEILSRIKARQLVQTCVLSSRWRRLWLTAPCLDIDAVASRRRKVTLKPLFIGDDDEGEEDEELDRFEDFIDGLLLRRSGGVSPLGTLRLSMPSSCPIWWGLHQDRSSYNSHIRWVRRGLRCSPAILDLSGIKMPPLSSGTHRLTRLRLHNVRLHKDFETHLSSGLPVLEDLEIRCTEMSKIARIASHTLKNLKVDNSPTSNEGTSLKFVVDAPRLSRLHLVVQFQRLGVFAVTLCEATSPLQASICFLDNVKIRQVHGSCYYWQDDKSLLLALCKLLGSLSTVSSLELSGFQDMAVGEQHIPEFSSPGTPWLAGIYQNQQTVQESEDSLPRPMLQAILDADHNKLPLLPDLKTLVLDKCQIGDNIQTLLWSLLQKMPSLEKLTLNNCECQKFSYGAASYILEKGRITSNLKLVEIMYNDRDDHEDQDTSQMEKILSMVQRDLPVTTKIHVSKLQN